MQDNKPDQARKEAIDIALHRLVEQVNEEVVVVQPDVEKALGAMTKDPELRWRRINLQMKVRCPDCGNIMHGDCGRYQCPVCTEVVIVKSPVLLKMCEKCASYKERCPGTASGTESKPVWSKKTRWRIINER